MQLLEYCTAALLIVGTSAAAAAQTPAPPQPTPGESSFTIFIRGTDVGREQANLSRSGSQWLLSSTGRLGDITINRFEIKYTADWQPVEMQVEATQATKEGQKKLQLATSFAVTSAIN